MANISLAQLRIQQLELKTTIGTYTWEQQIQQKVQLDLTLWLDTAQAAATDNLQDTLNYAQLVDRLKQFAAQQHCQLIETLAERLKQEIIVASPQVQAGSLTLYKPAAVPKAQSVSITLQWGEVKNF